jgi:HTH-type transcriptional regulator/antitoxin HigA
VEEKAMISELEMVAPIWPQMSSILSVPHDQKSYDRLVSVLDSLIDEVGENESHQLSTLLEVIGSLLESYENSQEQIGIANPVAVLKDLMGQHGLTQKDLGDIGSQGVISEILNGKRELNVRQIRALANRFSVSPAVFIA